MELNNVKIAKHRKTGTSAKTGKDYDMTVVIMTLPNGSQVEVSSGRYTYRAFDYLCELLDGKGGA